jgi:homogentisate 1,2-dioxygenase
MAPTCWPISPFVHVSTVLFAAGGIFDGFRVALRKRAPEAYCQCTSRMPRQANDGKGAKITRPQDTNKRSWRTRLSALIEHATELECVGHNVVSAFFPLVSLF